MHKRGYFVFVMRTIFPRWTWLLAEVLPKQQKDSYSGLPTAWWYHCSRATRLSSGCMTLQIHKYVRAPTKWYLKESHYQLINSDKSMWSFYWRGCHSCRAAISGRARKFKPAPRYENRLSHRRWRMSDINPWNDLSFLQVFDPYQMRLQGGVCENQKTYSSCATTNWKTS